MMQIPHRCYRARYSAAGRCEHHTAARPLACLPPLAQAQSGDSGSAVESLMQLLPRGAPQQAALFGAGV